MPKPIQVIIFGDNDLTPYEREEFDAGFDTYEQAVEAVHKRGLEFYQIVDVANKETLQGTMSPELWAGLSREERKGANGQHT